MTVGGQCRGALLERTLLAARNRGIKLLHMACLANNERMVDLARKFEAELTFDFTFGYNVKAADPAGTFFFRINELSADVTATLDNRAMAGNAGTLQASIADAALEFDVDLTIDVDDPASIESVVLISVPTLRPWM